MSSNRPLIDPRYAPGGAAMTQVFGGKIHHLTVVAVQTDGRADGWR